ncbi:TPA: helix-turn-helix transcriptional regulator, partial [Streptococcus pyogenes]|nr:helix-turn-helix transcriptional regulator [Streptococcus pyogenes]
MSFSERLKELRQLNNFTQQELADYLDVSRVTYTNYERG